MPCSVLREYNVWRKVRANPPCDITSKEHEWSNSSTSLRLLPGTVTGNSRYRNPTNAVFVTVNSTLQKRHPTNVLSFRIFGNTADNENDPYDPDKRSNAHLERIQDVGIRIFKYFSTELKNWGRVMSRVSSLQVTSQVPCKFHVSTSQVPCKSRASSSQVPRKFLANSSQVPRKFPVPRVSREDRQKVPESLLGSYKERSGESLGNYRDDQCFEYCIYSIC